MLHALFGGPPIPRGGATMTEGEIVAFLVTVSVFLVLMVIASAIAGVIGRRRVQMQSHVEEMSHFDVPQSPQGDNGLQDTPQQKEKEPLMRIPSLT